MVGLAELLLVTALNAQELLVEPLALGLLDPSITAAAADDPRWLYIGERETGRARIVDTLSGDLHAAILFDADVYAGTEAHGLLGVAIPPDSLSSRRVYVAYTPNATTLRLSAFRLRELVPPQADPFSETILTEYAMTGAQHFGGWIGFGPDGHLYVLTGDGQDEKAILYSPEVAQKTDLLLGKVLRYRVGASGESLEIPEESPFGNAVWALGLRDPQGASFDPETGDLWLTERRPTRQQIHRLRADTAEANFGWPENDGSPQISYDASLGGSLRAVGVYQGNALPGWRGRLFWINATPPRIWSAPFEGDGLGSTTEHTAQLYPPGEGLPDFSALGTDGQGELHLLSRVKGEVHRVSSPATAYFGSGFYAPDGWRESPWLGWLASTSFPDVYHLSHGWLHAYGEGGASCWLWDYVEAGWWWTNPTLYPYIYSERRGWLWYYEGSADPRWFYDFLTQSDVSTAAIAL